MNKLYVCANELIGIANNLAKFTNQIEVCFNKPDEHIYLQLDDNGLSLISDHFKPLYVYEMYNKVYVRRDNLSKELLIQAVKVKPDEDLLIIDATAGLAKDSLLLALGGYQVLMLEQNPILATIIHYALLNRIIPESNLQLIFTDSINFFKNYSGAKPYAIYLDPMFKKQDSALAKKDMQIIQLLTHEHNSYTLDEELFTLAYKLAKKVIIKRDDKQHSLVKNPLPNYIKQGKTIRYDVYLSS